MSWLINQIESCEKKSFEEYSLMKKDIWVEVNIKRTSKNIKSKFVDIANVVGELKQKEISNFKLIYVKNLGRQFVSPKSFVGNLEKMLLDYYKVFVQYLKNYIPPPPKMKEKGK